MKELTMIFSLFCLQHTYAQENVFTNSALEIKLVKIKCEENCDNPQMIKYVAVDTLEYGGALREGDNFRILIVNRSPKKQYYSLVDIEPTNQINLMFPSRRKEPEDYIINGNSTILVREIFTPTPPFGVDKLILISGETPQAGLWLRTLHEWQDTSAPESRGAERRNPKQFLQEMIWIMDGQPSVKFDECFFSIFKLAILPKKVGDGAHASSTKTNSGLATVNKFVLWPFLDGGCMDKKKSENLFNKYPIVDIYQPSVTFSTRGAEPAEVETKTYVIKGSSTAQKGTKEVRVNGDKASLNTKMDKGIQSSWSKEVELLPGKNLFTILSTTNDGFSNCEEIVINYNERENKVTNEGHNYSLFIGINKYTGMQPLNCCRKDALALKKVLFSRYQFESKYSLELFDEQATQNNIDSVFRMLNDKLTPADNLIVYFAGHGKLDADPKNPANNEGHWIPVDGNPNKNMTSISNHHIKQYMERSVARDVLIIADACFSGSFFYGSRDGNVSDKSESKQSRWMFCSGRNEVVSDCMLDGTHSPFANYLIEELSTYNGKGLTVSALYQSIKGPVESNSSTHQRPDARPVIETGDGGGEFVFRLRQ